MFDSKYLTPLHLIFRVPKTATRKLSVLLLQKNFTARYLVLGSIMAQGNGRIRKPSPSFSKIIDTHVASAFLLTNINSRCSIPALRLLGVVSGKFQ